MIVVEEEIVLPEQMSSRRPLLPLHKLMHSVLLECALTLKRDRHATENHGKRLYREALAWLESRSAAHPFNFEVICEHLGWDSESTRRMLLEAIDQGRLRQRMRYRRYVDRRLSL